MALAKQAKILTKHQQDAVLGLIASTRYPVRNRVIFLLSVRAGLRAKEIASLTWAMVTDAEGVLADAISLTDAAAKGKRGGRVQPPFYVPVICGFTKMVPLPRTLDRSSAGFLVLLPLPRTLDRSSAGFLVLCYHRSAGMTDGFYEL